MITGVLYYLVSSNARLKSENAVINAKLPAEASIIQNYVEQCLKQTSVKGIRHIALRGGYYNPRMPYLNLSGISLPYYHYVSDDGNVSELMPSKYVLEAQLANYIKDNINDCLGDFASFKKQGYELSADPESIYVNVALSPSSANVQLNYKIDAKLGNKEFTLTKFNAVVKTKLIYTYNTIKEYIDYQQKYPDYVVLSKLMKLSQEYDVHHWLFYMNNSVVFVTYINDTTFNSYVFANRYNWSEKEAEEKNSKPVIGSIAKQIAYVSDKYFVYEVNAVDPNGDKMFFLADSDFDVDINPLTGLINISLSKQLVGEHEINISVIDARGKIAKSSFMLEVKDE